MVLVVAEPAKAHFCCSQHSVLWLYGCPASFRANRLSCEHAAPWWRCLDGLHEDAAELVGEGMGDHNPVLIHEDSVCDIDGLSKWPESCKFQVGLVGFLVIMLDDTEEMLNDVSVAVCWAMCAHEIIPSCSTSLRMEATNMDSWVSGGLQDPEG